MFRTLGSLGAEVGDEYEVKGAFHWRDPAPLLTDRYIKLLFDEAERLIFGVLQTKETNIRVTDFRASVRSFSA